MTYGFGARKYGAGLLGDTGADLPDYARSLNVADQAIWHQTRFGNVAFGVYWGDHPEGMTDWQDDVILITRQIPGTSAFRTQIVGTTPSRVTYRLLFNTFEEYRALRDMRGVTATLRLFAGTVTVPGAFVRIVDESYLAIADVLLERLSDAITIPETREVEASATFMKQAS